MEVAETAPNVKSCTGQQMWVVGSITSRCQARTLISTLTTIVVATKPSSLTGLPSPKNLNPDQKRKQTRHAWHVHKSDPPLGFKLTAYFVVADLLEFYLSGSLRRCQEFYRSTGNPSPISSRSIHLRIEREAFLYPE